MVRKSVGTRTLTGLNDWLYRTFIKSRSPEADLADYRAGRSMRVYCGTYDIGVPRLTAGVSGPRAANKGGYLYLTRGRPITWHAMSGGEVVTIAPTGPLTPAGAMRGKNAVATALLKRVGQFHVETPDGTRTISIPRVDVGLVTEALAGA